MQKLLTFDQNLSDSQKLLFYTLDDWLKKEFELILKLRYSIPFYYQNSWILYLNPLKKMGFSICFLKAYQFKDKFLFLEMKNRKMVGSIDIFEISDEILALLYPVVKHAISIDSQPKNQNEDQKNQ